MAFLNLEIVFFFSSSAIKKKRIPSTPGRNIWKKKPYCSSSVSLYFANLAHNLVKLEKGEEKMVWKVSLTFLTDRLDGHLVQLSFVFPCQHHHHQQWFYSDDFRKWRKFLSLFFFLLVTLVEYSMTKRSRRENQWMDPLEVVGAALRNSGKQLVSSSSSS